MGAMKKASWILAIVFGLAFLGATGMNAALVVRARAGLAGGGRRAASEAARPRSERYQLAVIVPDADDSFFGGLLEGILEAAPGAGAAVQVFRYPASSTAEAERYYDIALRARADGLVMYSPRGAAPEAEDRYEEAAKAGVAFVRVGMDAPSGAKGPFIGSGSLLQGVEGGKIIGRSLGASALVGVILSAEGDRLYRGVLYALAAYPGAKVAAVAVAEPGILSGEAVAESMLRANPAINAIVCSSARDTVGAAQVLVDRGEVGKVLIVGADETPDIQRYIDKGVVAASVVRDSKRIGEEAVRAFSLLKAGRPAPRPVETGFLVIRMKGGRE